MRISDWSSDVCSSDLVEFLARRIAGDLHQLAALGQRGIGIGQDALLVATVLGAVVGIEMRDPRRQGDRAMEDRFDFLEHRGLLLPRRSEEHTSELQSLMRISYAVFCLKKKTYISIVQ